MSRYQIWIIVAGFLLIGLSNARAQESRDSGRRWMVSVAAGDVDLSESVQGIESAMQKAGFDDPSPCWFFCEGGVKHPFSSKGGGVSQLTVCRRFGRIAHVRALISGATLGTTHGFKARNMSGDFVFLEQSVRTYALLVGVNGEAAEAWIEAGPALHRIALKHTESAGGPPITEDRLGAVAAIGIAVPARKRFFIELQAQYRLVGTVKVDPADVTRAFEGTAGTLPQIAVNFSHAIWLIGLGIWL